MAFWSRKWNCLFLLYFVVSRISVSSAIRVDDIIYGRVKHIPLKRTQPDKFGFLREADFEKFGKELAELHNDRAKRSVEDTVRQTNRSMIEEFELKGDNHSVAFLHWAGKKSSVIYIYTCGKINNTQSDHILCEDAFFWRSNDSGSTFEREEKKFGKSTINNVDFCASNSKKVIVSVLSPKAIIYTSSDEGNSFQPIFLTFMPHVISCNPLSDLMIIGHDMKTNQVQYSVDGGKRWKVLAENVVNHYWGYGSKSEVFLEVKTKHLYSSVLMHAHLKDSEEPIVAKTFDKSLGTFMQGSFEIVGRYMFVQKYLKTKELHVFYQKNPSSHSGQNFFQRAQFPLKLAEGKGYKVVDASEKEVMVVVKHGSGYYNLYVSDESGVKYSLSLEYILSNETLVWGRSMTLVDIHRVRSLNGTYLANVIIGKRYMRSVITYNKGGDWHPLRAPLQDHTGALCYLPACSLHLHIVLSHWHYYIPGVLSSSSAVGIIIAQGNLGSRLGETAIGVFMSTDGGLTWTKEFNSFYDFVIGDHGGILAAVSLWRSVKDVWYSCTEGKEWKRVPLLNQVKVYGMVTEPGETKLIVNLFGQYDLRNFQWLSVKLNFSTVLNRKCQPENYTYWSPNDEVFQDLSLVFTSDASRAGSQCLLGQHIIYERRKSGDCCFNGEEYERKINATFCTCSAADFDCDFGFKHHGIDDVCVKTPSANPIPDPCPEGKTYEHSLGYRKVVGDRCVGGVLETLKPQTRYCPITLPGGLSIQINVNYIRAVSAHSNVSFILKQNKGSTKTTKYSWDFGDGTPLVNRTGLSHAKRVSHVYVKNGHYVVTVTAVNNAGHASVSTPVTVLDPITSVEIDPPHAVVVGEEAWFNVTFYTTGSPDPEEYKPSYGYVHFMWIFDNVSEPVLTLNHAVSHVFSATGQYDVTVQAISVVSLKGSHASVTVYDDLTSVRLTFDVSLDPQNSNSKEWRKWLAQRLQAFLSYTVLKIKPSRLEVVVLPGKLTRADVSITPAPTNTSKTRDEIVSLLKRKVAEGVVEIELLGGTVKATVTHVEKLPGRGSEDHLNHSNDSSEGAKGNTLLLIAVSIAASLVVIFLVLTLIYFLRRYSRLQSRYTHLRLYSDGAQLRDRDPLVENETDMEDEPSLYPQPGGSVRYIPVSTSADPDTDSDDELIDNFQAGSLVVMPMAQNGQLPEETANTQGQV